MRVFNHLKRLGAEARMYVGKKTLWVLLQEGERERECTSYLAKENLSQNSMLAGE